MVYILPFHSGISPPPKSDKGNHFIAALRFEKNLCPLEKSDKGFFSHPSVEGEVGSQAALPVLYSLSNNS